MQELDGDVAGILRDLVDFLDCLGEVELPEGLGSSREALLSRSRDVLQHWPSADSPEPYLDMNAGKSLLLLTAAVADEAEQLQEYVAADVPQSQRGSLQHYYETFQDFQGNGGKPKDDNKTEADKQMDDVVLLYASFSATQAKSRSVKSGSLFHLKRERKMFAPFNVFWLNRSCWVSLVGSHLLLYANERESRPYLVAPLRGYKGRAAPGALARDPRRSEAAFEIYCPGERTFQFVAKGAQEMREWLEAVAESLEPEECGAGRSAARAATFAEILELESNERMCIERVKEEKEKYQDVLNSPKSKTKDKQSPAKSGAPEKCRTPEESKEEAPPLPARTRRLPSLPSQEKISFEPREEPYDEEGLYHRIEDIRAQREYQYQNCQVRTGQKDKKVVAVTTASVDIAQETYDDVEAIVDKAKERAEEPMETYDDVQSVMRDRTADEPISYDDVQNLRIKIEKDKSPVKSPKSPQNTLSSFFGRVRNRKESMKKDDKKPKSPILITSPSPPTSPTSPTTITTTPQAPPTITATSNSVEPELPCYDDVSNLHARESCSSPQATDEEEYLCPPPPRPIYSRPPTIIKCTVPDEIYDDIGSCIEVSGNGCKGCQNVDVIKDYPTKNCSFLSDLQLSIEQEHYQVPKSNSRVPEYQEELYDDVALSETFKSRQRDSLVTACSPEKRVWSRFGSGKRIFDYVTRQTSFSESSEPAAGDEVAADQPSSPRVKPIQKLISKVENTLGKTTNKPNGVAQN